MSWFGNETYGERAARARGEQSKQQNQRSRERDDINYQRNQEANYERQNWQHKTMAFEAEQRAANRDGRAPVFLTPAMVPDMPRRYEPEEAPRSGGISWLGLLIIGGILLFVVIPTILYMLAPILQWVVQVIGTVLLVGAAGVSLIWLIMHLTAKGDPAKMHRAKLWNPVRIAKVLWGFASEWLAARRARKNRTNDGRH